MTKYKYVCKVCKRKYDLPKCVLNIGEDESIPYSCPFMNNGETPEWKRVEPKVKKCVS